MSKTRITYLIVIFSVILTGILSRKLDFIPLFVGDVLYAVMVYFMVRFVFLNGKSSVIFITALLLCFVVEFQQTLEFSWLVAIRKTSIGHYALGEGFLWSDLLYYTLGAGLGGLVDVFLRKSYKL
ncbi:DUF2809 domain-containing protein [Flavobacterium amniphilum]|uniref:ribosomal maturation YjgA family protein n=1 Tax=Flavobacterium amniphilum TaxID=1834035 RepID=UPI00202A5C50|nr:DUF2809 domain-containing protein [Flavobacterium amniphilum]MCL9805354.1 DUF2809 domain-containing protein [Flavobacterium amniphilum]